MTRKRTEWIARTIDETAGTLTLQPMRQTEGMDTPVAFDEAAVFTFATASATNRTYAEAHGWSARIGDVLAQSAGTTIAEKMADGKALIGHYESGSESWNVRGTKKAVDPTAMLAQLLANDPEKLAAIIAAAQAAAQAKLDNAQGAPEPTPEG